MIPDLLLAAAITVHTDPIDAALDFHTSLTATVELTEQQEAEALARQQAIDRASRDVDRVTQSAVPAGGTVWDRLAQCESGGNWSYNGSSGYDGGLQFLPSTWTGKGGDDFATYAWQATREEQIIVAERLLSTSGWGAWPACSAELGLP